MKRLSAVCAALVIGIAAVAPAIDAAARDERSGSGSGRRGRSGPGSGLERRPIDRGLQRRPIQRVPLNLHRDFPIKRHRRDVIVVRPQVRVRITPRVFLPPVVFGGVIIDDRRFYDRYRDDRGYYYDSRYRPYDSRYRPYNRDRLAWFDSEYLYGADGWSEFTLECNAYGDKLWFEVRYGRLRVDWAEIVFENGEAQVVDFNERSLGPGVYPLLDFRGGRRVSHVRMVAEAASREAEVILRLEQ